MAEFDHAAAVLTIDLAAICENWRLLRDKVQPAQCGAVVKANADGLGAEVVSRALYGAGCPSSRRWTDPKRVIQQA